MSKQKTEIAKVRAFISGLGFRDIVELLLHPVLVPLYVIPAWVKSLWASRILLWGQWTRYHGFHAHNAINNLFYKTQWININRYGRIAKSPTLGLGDYSLGNWWHLSSLASYIYANAGAVTTLLGTLFWVLSHLIWLQTTNWAWVLLITAIVMFSTTAYLMAFARQNYQILSWMWMPIALYGLMNHQLVIAAFAFFAAALLGITALFVSIILVFAYALHSGSFNLLFALLPAVAVAILNFIPIIQTGGLKSSVVMIGKMIGFFHVDVRYKRDLMKLGLFNIYYLLLYAISLCLIWSGSGGVPTLLLVAYLLFLMNQMFMRFADPQSVIMLFTTVAAAYALRSPASVFVVMGLMAAMSPLPLFFFGTKLREQKSFLEFRHYLPFDITNLQEAIRNFLSVPKGSRVLFAFSDPGDSYDNLFDGQRILLELPLMVASESEIHLFPDCYAAIETNYPDAPSIWGRDLAVVEQNIKHWGAQYTIVYQESKELESHWMENFDLISVFSWKDWETELRGEPLWHGYSAPPVWFLLKAK